MHILQVTGREEWGWLAGSFLVAMLWTNLFLLFSPWADPARAKGDAPRSLAERLVFRLTNWELASPLYQWLRTAYFVGIPAAALFWGRDVIVGRFLGLQRLLLPAAPETSSFNPVSANWASWIQDLGWATGIGLSSVTILLLARVAYRRAVRRAGEGNLDHEASRWISLRETIYHEIHWAFYRNAPVVALGLYRGVWVGLAIVALEALINPAWRKKVGEPTTSWSALSQGAIAVASAALFLRTQNLWFSLIVHWGIAATVRAYPTRIVEADSWRSF